MAVLLTTVQAAKSIGVPVRTFQSRAERAGIRPVKTMPHSRMMLWSAGDVQRIANVKRGRPKGKP